MSVLSDLFQSIADAIRTKTGSAATMKPAEFPDQIKSIVVGSGSGEGGEDGMVTELLWENSSTTACDALELSFTREYEWYIIEHDNMAGIGVTIIPAVPIGASTGAISCEENGIEIKSDYSGYNTTLTRYLRSVTPTAKSLSIDLALQYSFGYNQTAKFSGVNDKCVLHRIWGVYSAAA